MCKTMLKKVRRNINWLKIIALILMIIEIIVAIRIDKNCIEGNLNLWRLYTGCILFIPVNVMIIFAKRS